MPTRLSVFALRCCMTAASVFVCGNPLAANNHTAAASDDPVAALRTSAIFYVSFDEAIAGDYGHGDRAVQTRFDHPTEKGRYEYRDGYDETVFHIVKDKGVSGGALQCDDVLPRRGRMFFPASKQLPYKKNGWNGTVSFWMNTNPDTMLKTRYCDPVQITEKGAGNGGWWIDFPDSKPRALRMGLFSAIPPGGKPVAESDPNAPLVRIEKIGFQDGDWHHLAMTAENFDTAEDNAHAVLYIDGKQVGELKQRKVSMQWDLSKTGIYFAVGFIGKLDELAVFERALSVQEIQLLHKHPDALKPLAMP